MPRWLAILLVYLCIGAAIFGIGLLIVPPMVDGVEDLSDDLPGYVDDLRDNETFRDYDDRYDITDKLTEQAEELPSKLGDAAGTLRDVTVGVFSRFVQLFSILVITFFLLMDGRRMLEFVYRQLPPEREPAAARRSPTTSRSAIAGYVFGAFVIATLAGLVTYVTLTILDVPFAVPLAILIAFFGLIPLVGATIGGILVGIVVAFVSFPVGLIVWVVVLIVYQQVENNLIQPFVYGRAVQVHPLDRDRGDPDRRLAAGRSSAPWSRSRPRPRSRAWSATSGASGKVTVAQVSRLRRPPRRPEPSRSAFAKSQAVTVPVVVFANSRRCPILR